MKSVMVMAMAMQAALSTAAFACDGQSGAVIFEDKFPDDSGGWDQTMANLKIEPPTLNITVDPTNQSTSVQNLTFNAANADYCMQFTFPPALAKNPMTVGVEFWATDINNTYLFMVDDGQSAALYKKSSGNWNTVFNGVKVDGFNTAAGATHTLLVQAEAGTLILSADGTKVKTIRAQMPAGDPRFGAFVQSTNPLVATDPPAVFKISEFSVTAGQ